MHAFYLIKKWHCPCNNINFFKQTETLREPAVDVDVQLILHTESERKRETDSDPERKT